MQSGGARKGRTVPLSDVNSWPDTGIRREQSRRRFPELAPTKPPTPHSEVRSNQRCDAVAPPCARPSRGVAPPCAKLSRGGWLGRASSSPEAPLSRRDGEWAVFCTRLISAPVHLAKREYHGDAGELRPPRLGVPSTPRMSGAVDARVVARAIARAVCRSAQAGGWRPDQDGVSRGFRAS